MNLIERLSYVQKNLIAPKSQTNSFGKYKYRSCEDIQKAVKPLLTEDGDAILTINDEITSESGRLFIKSTATLSVSGDGSISCSSLAMHALEKKGMDPSQITGSASSYARKYALCAMFCIDDSEDPDSMKPENNDTREITLLMLADRGKFYDEEIRNSKSLDSLKEVWVKMSNEIGPYKNKFVRARELLDSFVKLKDETKERLEKKLTKIEEFKDELK